MVTKRRITSPDWKAARISPWLMPGTSSELSPARWIGASEPSTRACNTKPVAEVIKPPSASSLFATALTEAPCGDGKVRFLRDRRRTEQAPRKGQPRQCQREHAENGKTPACHRISRPSDMISEALGPAEAEAVVQYRLALRASSQPVGTRSMPSVPSSGVIEVERRRHDLVAHTQGCRKSPRPRPRRPANARSRLLRRAH